MHSMKCRKSIFLSVFFGVLDPDRSQDEDLFSLRESLSVQFSGNRDPVLIDNVTQILG